MREVTYREETYRMVEVCGCGENRSNPVDLDGDGIAEWCRICGDYVRLEAREDV